jgi:hypothetical protein
MGKRARHGAEDNPEDLRMSKDFSHLAGGVIDRVPPI